MPVYEWSKTAASNATADSTINWSEGQAPSTVNDSGRAMMAEVAKYRDDIAGVIVTGGSSTAFTVTSNQVFDSLAHMDGAMIAFTPHTTSGDAPTLNVDGLGAKKIRIMPSVDLPEGSLVEGTPYVATYYNTAGEFILHNLGGNPYSVPLGSGLDYWGSTTPNSAFAFPYGQEISRTTYAGLYSLIGTTYGNGNGSTTFNLPDKRGRVSAAYDGMGGSAAGRLNTSTMSTGAIGGTGGAQTQSLSKSNLPDTTFSFSGTPATITVNSPLANVVQGSLPAQWSITAGAIGPYQMLASSATAAYLFSSGGYTPAGTVSSGGSGTAHNNVQPTIICNYIIRIK